ncbi:hypothetical protein PM027_21665 [[Clostridium] symbiosum]|uniref:hypothetical protein n=1 Tax=Clostridium symbiosum TaxID=1512 RepID=UPI001896E16A|nr:hypothetical protein [[Clostridium] symbiosum]MDB2020649.1 hypothetical protein [[Clostridium] symbiosum]
MSKRKHRVRRGGIAVIPIVISIIFSLLIPVNVTAESFFASLQVIIGVWATLLGFIITTVSILLTFTGSKLTEEIKATGHYKRGRKFFCVFKIGSSIQLELDM